MPNNRIITPAEKPSVIRAGDSSRLGNISVATPGNPPATATVPLPNPIAISNDAPAVSKPLAISAQHASIPTAHAIAIATRQHR